MKKRPVLLLIDDTVIPKFGKTFEDVDTMYDHSAQARANCLDGHCFVRLMMAVPVQTSSDPGYVYVSLAYRMWRKGRPSKLDTATTLLKDVMTVIGSDSTRNRGARRDSRNRA